MHFFSSRAQTRARLVESRRQRSLPGRAPAVSLLATARVVAHGLIRAGSAEISALRRQPGHSEAGSLPASLLRHADAQTVVGLAAVLNAMEGSGLDARRYSGWGIVAAPRFLGRSELAAAFAQYAVDGAWGVSPHLVPHHSLHSMAGSISQALKISGPNLGAGGGRDGEREALLAAMTLLAGQRLPGVWLVVTGWVPELIPADLENARGGTAPAALECRGLALGLAEHSAEESSPWLRLGVAAEPQSEPGAPFDALGLVTWLAQAGGGARMVRRASWSLGGRTWIELEPASTPALQST